MIEPELLSETFFFVGGNIDCVAQAKRFIDCRDTLMEEKAALEKKGKAISDSEISMLSAINVQLTRIKARASLYIRRYGIPMAAAAKLDNYEQLLKAKKVLTNRTREDKNIHRIEYRRETIPGIVTQRRMTGKLSAAKGPKPK